MQWMRTFFGLLLGCCVLAAPVYALSLNHAQQCLRSDIDQVLRGADPYSLIDADPILATVTGRAYLRYSTEQKQQARTALRQTVQALAAQLRARYASIKVYSTSRPQKANGPYYKVSGEVLIDGMSYRYEAFLRAYGRQACRYREVRVAIRRLTTAVRDHHLMNRFAAR